ncbi:glycosyltransferase family 4 protein [Candidatus Woesebacteria bacterium]|nr:glycosyltransferase family 4 protein [Candidatus Woesebacteria bacterium]
MNIGIDISQIVYTGTGVARFTRGLVDAIVSYDTENTWTFFFSSFRQKIPTDVYNKINKSNHKLVCKHIPPTLLGVLWNDRPFWSHAMNNSLLKWTQKLDWFITSDWAEAPALCKKATIVHDLVFRCFPETVHPLIIKTQEKRLERVVNESNVIFADSHTTKKDLQEFFSIKKADIMVNYPGVKKMQLTVTHDVLAKYDLKKPFILTVGKLEPRKNMSRLIEAVRGMNVMLIVVGIEGWGEANNHQTHNKNVRFLGFVSDEDLSALYSKATIFVFPSLYEGFGYPIVEAMQHYCPVIASNTSSLAEIAKDAALLCDPTDVQNIKQTIEQLLADTKLQQTLSEKGKQRAAKFSWKTYYNTLIKALGNET